MGGDRVPGPLDPMVRWFEEWKEEMERIAEKLDIKENPHEVPEPILRFGR